MLTGNLQMMGYEFFFTFDEEKLSLIPDKKMKDEIKYAWFYNKRANGVYTLSGNPKFIDEDYLYGYINETNEIITFLPNKHVQLSENNGIITISLLGYFISNSISPMIGRMAFNSVELNYIYPINQAFEISYKPTEHNGKFHINTYDFDSTTTATQKFIVRDTEVEVYFGITRTTSISIENPPLKLTSSMVFIFDETQDYSFILELNRIAKEFLQFLCNRKNVCFNKIQLSNMQGKVGHLEDIKPNTELETIPLKNGRYIQQKYISGYEGIILNDIATNNLYLRHLGKSFKDSRVIDAANFVLRTAAFEWEYKRLFSESVLKSDKSKELEEKATNEIDRLIQNSEGKLKEIYKRLKKSIPSYVSLSQKISKVFEKYGDDILNIFGEHIYKLNGVIFEHSAIGLRMAKQRNNFAHGNLDKDFINESLLDVVFLEQIVLVMQLQHFGIDKTSTKKIINEMFRHNLSKELIEQ